MSGKYHGMVLKTNIDMTIRLKMGDEHYLVYINIYMKTMNVIFVDD